MVPHSRQSVKDVMSSPTWTFLHIRAPSGWERWCRTGLASAVAIAVEGPLGGGRDSVGDATQLHQSIIASGLPGTVHTSLTIGYPSPWTSTSRTFRRLCSHAFTSILLLVAPSLTNWTRCAMECKPPAQVLVLTIAGPGPHWSHWPCTGSTHLTVSGVVSALEVRRVRTSRTILCQFDVLPGSPFVLFTEWSH